MIELDANGQIPQTTRIRVYAVAGFSENRPFHGFNVWTDAGPRKPEDIERYDTFQGWASEELDVATRDASPGLPTKPGEFRVGLMAESRPGCGPYPVVHQHGPHYSSPETEEDFLGWLTPVQYFPLKAPQPKILVRFRAQLPEGLVDGLLVTHRPDLQAAFGKTANFGRIFGLDHDLTVMLKPEYFLQMSDNQVHIETVARCADQGTVCGFNPLLCLI